MQEQELIKVHCRLINPFSSCIIYLWQFLSFYLALAVPLKKLSSRAKVKKGKDGKKDGKDKGKEGEPMPAEEPVRDPVKEQEMHLMQRY